MNKIFKIKRNSFGQSVVTSELAKNKGNVVSLSVLILSSLITLPIHATPISIQGAATSENAVSIGSNSFATAINGVANGQGAIATGQGFTREQFEMKKQDAQSALDAIKSKQDDLSNKRSQLNSTTTAIDSLNQQIDDLSRQQASISNKIAERDNLLPQQANIQNKVDVDISALNDAKTALDGISNNGKNLYLNFTDVLNTLNWSKLNGTDEGRNELASELKAKIESNFTDFASKYSELDYRNIVDGYINRQASYQGSYEYLDSIHNKTKYLLGGFEGNNKLFNDLFFHSSLNETGYTTDYTLENKSNNFLKQSDVEAWGRDNKMFGNSYLNIDNRPVNGDGLGRNLMENHNHSEYLNPNSSKTYTQQALNTLVLIDESIKKSKTDNAFNLLNPYNGESNSNGVNRFYFIDSYNSDLISFGQDFQNNYNNHIYKNYSDINRVIFGLKGASSNIAKVNMLNYDGNIGVLTKLKDLTPSNQNLITSDDITHFKSWIKTLKDYDSSIDWGFSQSAINLADYRQNLDKVIAYNTKIDTILDLYQSIIDERKKSDADIAKIESETKQLMLLKDEIINGIDNMDNFIAGITPTYNKEWADYYLNYGKAESDKIISRINNELKLYNDKDELIVETTGKAKELQTAYDDAKEKLEQDQAELDKINKQIDDLALTDIEKATDDVKKAKEAEKAEREVDKARLEDEIKTGEKELEGLKEQLSKTSLKDLGLRSQAYGSGAFASGDDSIAMGTNATVTSNDGVAIGRNSNVTGKQSIALGAENTVSGDKSIAIGVGHTVSGYRSSTIGDPNTITGDDVFVAGNNNNVASNNVMVMGNNVTVGAGFDGAVVLGNSSTVSAANPTASNEIKGTTYNFAGGNPTSVVSMGASGQERQITNVAAGRIAETSTDAINGSQLYALAAAIAQKTVTPADVSDEVTNQLETKLTAGDNITIDKNDATNTFTITGKNTQSVVVAGQGVSVGSADNAIGTKDYTVSAKLGEGLAFDDSGAIKANGTTISAGKNVTVTGDATNGYVISATGEITNEQLQDVINQVNNIVDTNTQSVTKEGKGIAVDAVDNIQGTKDYTISVKLGDGLTYDDNGNVVNDLKLNAGDNVQVTGDAKTGYTISATDTNTQSTVTAGQGITVKAADNAIGTKDYTVEAKLGKGLKIDENGAIAATAQPINGGNGVTVTTNEQGESVVDVVGVTTTTDDGKSYTRSDLTKAVGVKGDGKNIRTTTATNGDVQVRMSDDIQVNSVTVNNGPTINQNGINANNTRVTNVQDGVAPTDAVNVRQLNQQGNQINNRIDNLADNVRKNKKRADAGIASTAAMSNIPQVMLAGKSGVGVGVGHRGGQSAVAVGYSRASDNAKHIIKLSAGIDTQSKATVGAGYMYQW